MLETKACINIYSELNDWIDFCIVLGANEDLVKAVEIAQKSYNEWFENDSCEPIADYISSCLTKNDIDHEIYFK